MKQIRHYLVLIILLTAFMVNAQTITSVSLSPAGPYCPGAAVSVTFVINTTGGNFKPSNTFTAELSNSTGSFASPVVIGTLKTTAAGTINATLPAAPGASNGYVIRVTSSNPASTGASSSAFEIKATCGGGGGGTSLDNLTDVTITTPATGQLLKYDGSAWVNSAAAIVDITGLEEKLTAKLDQNGPILAGSKAKITYDNKGLVTGGTNAEISDINQLQTALDAKLDKTAGLSNLTTDVLITSPIDKQVLTYNGSKWVNLDASGGGSSTLATLTDVTITTPATGQLLKYDGSAWVNSAAAIVDITGLQTALDAKLDITASSSYLSGVYLSPSLAKDEVLTYNGFYWTNAAASGGGGSGWSLLGNSFTNKSVNFIGTTDANPLVFKYNNSKSGIIDANNTAFGNSSAASNSSGTYNSSLGFNSLLYNTTGSLNAAFGTESLYNNKTGSRNTAVGHRALFGKLFGTNNTGNNNSAFGVNALLNVESGLDNVGIGYNAGTSDGSYNVAVGSSSGVRLESGSYLNTSIGRGAGGIGLLTNSTAIGAEAAVDASNKVRIGNTFVETIEGQVGWSHPSDGRYKKNVKEDAPGLNLIMKLRPVTYNFEYSKFSEHLKEKNADKTHLQQRESKKEMGFVAQEVEKALKEAGTDVNNLVNVPQSAEGHYSLVYSELVVPLVKAVQEQQKIIEELKKAVEVLQKQSPAATIGGSAAQANVLEMPETSTLLGQNIPNPFNTKTIIPFRLPANCNSAAIVITNITTGKSIRAIPVSSSETQLSLDASKLPSGNYAYSLYIDGKVVDTKKMMMVR